jgi:hypothetical protein
MARSRSFPRGSRVQNSSCDDAKGPLCGLNHKRCYHLRFARRFAQMTAGAPIWLTATGAPLTWALRSLPTLTGGSPGKLSLWTKPFEIRYKTMAQNPCLARTLRVVADATAHPSSRMGGCYDALYAWLRACPNSRVFRKQAWYETAALS